MIIMNPKNVWIRKFFGELHWDALLYPRACVCPEGNLDSLREGGEEAMQIWNKEHTMLICVVLTLSGKGIEWTGEFPLVNVAASNIRLNCPLGGRHCDDDKKFCGKVKFEKDTQEKYHRCCGYCVLKIAMALNSLSWGLHSFLILLHSGWFDF